LKKSQSQPIEVINLADTPPSSPQQIEVINLADTPPSSPPRGRGRERERSSYHESPSPPPSPSEGRGPTGGRSRAPHALRSASSQSAHSLKRRRSRSIGPELRRDHKRARSNAVDPHEETHSSTEESDQFVLSGSESDNDKEGEDEDSDQEESMINHANILPGRRYKEIIEHGLGTGVVILPELKAIICTFCRYTVTPSYLARHCNDKGHPKSFTPASLKKKMAELNIPMNHVPELPQSACLIPTGLDAKEYWKCGGCQHLFNPDETTWKRHSCSKKSQVHTTVAHWTRHKVFEVVTDASAPDSHMTVESWAKEKLLELSEGKETQIINPTTPASRIHPFLIRSGWVDFFRPLEMSQLETLKGYTTLPSPEDPVRILLGKVFGELQQMLKKPSNREFQYHLFTPIRCVAYNNCSIFT
jgi:hypothetical protein